MSPPIKCSYTKMVPVTELVPNSKNPNQHDADQIERLAQIIEYSGWRRPIRVSKRSGLMTVGHGALLAAKLKKWAEVPVDYQDYDSEEQEFADMVADNEIARWAVTDLKLVNLEVPSLGPDFDIKMLGFKNFEIEPMDKFEKEMELDENIETDIECPSCGYKWKK